MPAGSRRRGGPCLEEKCRRNDFQNVCFVLSGRLSAGVARAVPPLIAGPCSRRGGAVFVRRPLSETRERDQVVVNVGVHLDEER